MEAGHATAAQDSARERKRLLGLALWAAQPAPVMANQAFQAEQIGLESAWLIDSQLLCREVYVTLALCLARTTRLRVATGVTQPVTRDPSVVASAFATLDEMAPGRPILGLGSGFSSLRTIGRPAARIAEMERFAATVGTLLAAQPASFGEAIRAGLSWLSKPASVPIHIAASGPRMMRSAGRTGDGAILLHGTAPDLLARALGWLDEGSAAAGRAAEALEVSCWAPFSLDADRRKAYDRARTRVAGALAQADPEWFEGEERQAVRTLQQNYKVGDHAQAMARHAGIVPDSLVRKFAVTGDAVEVRDQLQALQSHPRLDRVILNPQVSGAGALPLEDVLRNLGETVLPHL